LKPPLAWLEKPFLAAEEKIYSLFLPRQKQADKVQILEGKLRQLAVEQNQLSSCLEENLEMRKLLGAPLSPKWKFLPAKVVGVSEQMRIDKGEKDGLEEGMMVVSENILVGRVVAVGRNYSLVQIPTGVDSKIPVIVREASKTGIQARGILTGHSGSLLLDKVLQAEDIREGDLVTTSGEDDWLPDLLIGQIEEVLAEPAEIYKKAQVSPLIDYRKLRTVFIVISN
ncbi:rod shape-determining protein MreC, partial [Candidatus Shapirobacteria bacterium CG09_land_8_20_14_0_10_39_12]